jgi:asparagine synthase (glutamine-hydrolysing)
MFDGISILPPGHNLFIGIGNPEPRIERYWKIDYTPDDHPRADEIYIDELRNLLDDAAHIMLRADVPVGAYLSGGLDSSMTTALIRKEEPAALKTFSVTFADPRFDESEHQRGVAAYLGTDHAAVHCSGGDIARVFPNVVWHAEQPMVRAAPAPLFLLSRLVRDSGFKVVLTGEGADEVLGGYDIFKEAKIRRFWGRCPESNRRPLLLKRLYPYMENIQSQPVAYLKAFFHVSPGELRNPLFSHLPRWELGMSNLRFLSEEVKDALRDWDPLEELKSLLPQEYESWDWLSRAQYLEFAFLMPGYILSAQGDRMALAHSIESRFPFLDHRVIEFGAKLPLKLRINGLIEKYALRRAARGLIPDSIIRRTKQPYRAPDAESFAGPSVVEPEYVTDMMSTQRLDAYHLFNPKAVGLLLKKARQGHVTGVRDDMAFVGVLSSQLLAEQFIGSRIPSEC